MCTANLYPYSSWQELGSRDGAEGISIDGMELIELEYANVPSLHFTDSLTQEGRLFMEMEFVFLIRSQPNDNVEGYFARGSFL